MLASKTQGTSRVEALDLLRLVAVAAVVIYHYGFWGPSSHDVPQVALPWMASFAQYGFLGVPVFFIITGFVIAYSLRVEQLPVSLSLGSVASTRPSYSA
jgi:peptidoglycan/LPS O-acetylase OafA/YrhL